MRKLNAGLPPSFTDGWLFNPPGKGTSACRGARNQNYTFQMRTLLNSVVELTSRVILFLNVFASVLLHFVFFSTVRVTFPRCRVPLTASHAIHASWVGVNNDSFAIHLSRRGSAERFTPKEPVSMSGATRAQPAFNSQLILWETHYVLICLTCCNLPVFFSNLSVKERFVRVT